MDAPVPTPVASVPSFTMNWVRFEDGSYGVDLKLHGLATQRQAEAAMEHMQRLFCGPEIKPGEMN